MEKVCRLSNGSSCAPFPPAAPAVHSPDSTSGSAGADVGASKARGGAAPECYVTHDSSSQLLSSPDAFSSHRLAPGCQQGVGSLRGVVL